MQCPPPRPHLCHDSGVGIRDGSPECRANYMMDAMGACGVMALDVGLGATGPILMHSGSLAKRL